VWGRHLLGVDSVNNASSERTPASNLDSLPTFWFIDLVVGNRLVLVICILVLLLYVAAVVSRIVLHVYWGPVRIVIDIERSVVRPRAVGVETPLPRYKM